MKRKLAKLFLSIAISTSFVGAITFISEPQMIINVEAARIKLSQKKISLDVGKSTTLKINVPSKKVKWTSSNKKVATVSSKGKVTAKKVGTVTIKAKVNGKIYNCKVTVKKPIQLNVKNKSLIVGGTPFQLKVTGTNKKVVWTSSNKKVATVSSKGKVTAKSKGTCTITAKVNKKTLKCAIRVENIQLNKDKMSLRYGQTDILKVNGTSQKINWKSQNPSIASVSKTGQIVPKNSGNTTITAEVGGKTLKCAVDVKSQDIAMQTHDESLYLENNEDVSTTITEIISQENKNLSINDDDHYIYPEGWNYDTHPQMSEAKAAIRPINDLRLEKGRNAIKWSDELYEAALQYAKDYEECQSKSPSLYYPSNIIHTADGLWRDMNLTGEIFVDRMIKDNPTLLTNRSCYQYIAVAHYGLTWVVFLGK